MPTASTKKREIMAPSPRPVFSLRPRGMINVGGRGWVGSGQMLIDVPILEIKGKKKCGPQLQNSFLYSLTHSLIHSLFVEHGSPARHGAGHWDANPGSPSLRKLNHTNRRVSIVSSMPKSGSFPISQMNSCFRSI